MQIGLFKWILDACKLLFVLECSELDKYLEDDYVALDTKNFNVLGWWKVAGTRYPTLRLIARDIYAIPISTVALESAFSTSGRVLSEHRSRLTSDLLEALMCSQDWIRNRYKGTCIEYNISSYITCFLSCLNCCNCFCL